MEKFHIVNMIKKVYVKYTLKNERACLTTILSLVFDKNEHMCYISELGVLFQFGIAYMCKNIGETIKIELDFFQS